MRLTLVPRTREFYDLFAEAGANALQVARSAEIRFREFPDSSVTQDEIKALEHEGDRVTRELVQLLNTQYVTPFDREDILELATSTDDVVDYIEEACALLDLYGVKSATRQALDQCRILVGAVEHLAHALGALKELRGIPADLLELKRLEDEGDQVVRDAIAALFQDSRIDPLIVIRWKDIFEALETAIDACENVGKVLGNVVVKNT